VIARLIERLFYWTGLLRQWRRGPVIAVVRDGSLPKLLAPRTVYILYEDGEPWQASMSCPCGCHATLEMNLLPDERPMWTASIGAGQRATLRPSVWRKVGCKSHFFVRNGDIEWVPDRTVRR